MWKEEDVSKVLELVIARFTDLEFGRAALEMLLSTNINWSSYISIIPLLISTAPTDLSTQIVGIWQQLLSQVLRHIILCTTNYPFSAPIYRN
jgi:hypothetical protein